MHSSDHTAASPFSPPWDKVAHFVFFAGLACLGWIADVAGAFTTIVVLTRVSGRLRRRSVRLRTT